MTMIEYLNQLTFNGTIDNLYSQGVIGYHWLMYRDIYNLRDALIRQGHKRNDSVHTVANKFRIDRSSVYRAIKKMETKIS